MECKICRAPDPGNHYRQNCCRACAAFFRRTTQLKLRYRCKRVGNCKINKDNRFFCRHCRMKKCIAAGMTSHDDPSASMDFYLDTSAPVQPAFNSLSEQEENLPCIEDEEHDIYTSENILNNYENFIVQFKGRLKSVLSQEPCESKFPFNLTLHQQAAVAYTAHRSKWPHLVKQMYIDADAVDVNADFCDSFKAIQYVAEFCMELPCFAQLSLDQKSFIMDHYVSPFMHFERMATTVELLGNDIEDTRSVYYNGQAGDVRKACDTSKISNCSAEELKSMLHGEEDLYVQALRDYKRLNPDQFELMYMLSASMWNLIGKEGISTETLKVATEMQDRLSEELYFYYRFERKISNFAARIYKIHNLFCAIDRMDELWEEDSRISKTFDLFHFDVHFDNLKE